jgi:hypothetical protein
MTQDFIYKIARLDPNYSEKSLEASCTFRQVYLTPAYGWEFARSCADARVKFPVTLTGRDHWLLRAYMMLLDSARYHDIDVETAFQILQQPVRSGTLKALLIAGLGKPIDAHLKLVAAKTGYPKRTVEAFEILFFNVLDRHEDGGYLSEITYPHCRIVELAEDYIETTPIADLILRAAYNLRDLELVLRLAGMTEEEYRKELTKLPDCEAKLQARIFGNALLIAKLGILNQPSAGLERATQLLASGRFRKGRPMEAESQKEPYDTSGELAAALAAIPPLTNAERREMHAAARPGRSYLHDDDGNITACDYSDVVPPASQSANSPSNKIVRFPEPITAVWRNKDYDAPVRLVARMSEPGLPDHYLTDTSVGIPASEVFFEN